jgi:hypothetical protein
VVQIAFAGRRNWGNADDFADVLTGCGFTPCHISRINRTSRPIHVVNVKLDKIFYVCNNVGIGPAVACSWLDNWGALTESIELADHMVIREAQQTQAGILKPSPLFR